MNPSIREVELNAINISYLYILLLSVKFFHTHKDCINICIRSKVDTILCYEILWEGLAKFACLQSLLCQRTKEERNTNKGITTIMAFWIDNTTITFTTNNSTDFLHLCGNIHLTNSRSIILTAMLLCHVTQSTS